MDIPQHIVTDIIAGLLTPFAQAAQAGHFRLFWPYLIVAVVIAFFVYRHARAAHEAEADGGFLAFLLPRAIWRHRSALTDVGVMLTGSVIFAVALAPILPASEAVTKWLLAQVAPGATIATASGSLAQLVIFTLVLLVVDDFARFFIHWLMHRVPALWELHKVHHAAEVLTPFTAYRFHPLDTALAVLTVAGFVGAANVAFVLLWGEGLEVVTLFHANVGIVVFNLLGGVLRHSHVWLSFGPRVERYLVSPAMHQIHHSCEARHIDKNMGYHLSIWDRMFGTAYIPQGRERFRLGIGEETAELRTVTASMLRPPFGMVKALVPSITRRTPETKPH